MNSSQIWSRSSRGRLKMVAVDGEGEELEAIVETWSPSKLQSGKGLEGESIVGKEEKTRQDFFKRDED